MGFFMKIQRAAVVGAGTMGAGIAQVLSSAGITVILKDVKRNLLKAGLAKSSACMNLGLKRRL